MFVQEVVDECDYVWWVGEERKVFFEGVVVAREGLDVAVIEREGVVGDVSVV